MTTRKVTDRPLGKRVPWGWKIMTNGNTRLCRTMFCRWLPDGSWERVESRSLLAAWIGSGWVFIRRMTKRELSAARKEQKA